MRVDEINQRNGLAARRSRQAEKWRQQECGVGRLVDAGVGDDPGIVVDDGEGVAGQGSCDSISRMLLND